MVGGARVVLAEGHWRFNNELVALEYLFLIAKSSNKVQIWAVCNKVRPPRAKFDIFQVTLFGRQPKVGVHRNEKSVEESAVD